MSKQRNLAPLAAGVALVLIGGLFLAINVLDFGWVRFLRFEGLRFILPILLLLWGGIKLVRHFSWDAEKLQQHPGRASLLGGLFWIALGTTWFMALVGRVQFLDFFGLYWPAILVLFGLGKIVDYYRFRGLVRLRAGEIVGVFFVVLVGFTIGRMAEAHLPFLNFDFPAIVLGDKDIRIRSVWGETYRWDDETRESAEGLAGLEVSNSYGDIRMEGGSGEEIEVHLRKEVVARDREDAKQVADQIQIQVSRQGDLLRLGTNREGSRSGTQRLSTHLELKVPARLAANLENRHGDVRVSGMESDLSVQNSSGDVIVQGQQGNIKAANEYGQIEVRSSQGGVNLENRRGRISLDHVTGDAQVTTFYDLATVSDLTGNLLLRNRFGSVRVQQVSGTVDVEAPGSSVSISDTDQMVQVQNSQKSVSVSGIRGPVELETSYSKAEITRVGGSVDLRATHADVSARDVTGKLNCKAVGSRLVLKGLEGGFDVVTTLRPITIEGFQGVGVAQNEFDDINIATSQPLSGELSVSNKQGNIDLRLPRDAGFVLSAQAPGGRIRSDFETLRAEQQPESEGPPLLEATIGKGGPKVRLQTTQGEIRIRQSGGSRR